MVTDRSEDRFAHHAVLKNPPSQTIRKAAFENSLASSLSARLSELRSEKNQLHCRLTPLERTIKKGRSSIAARMSRVRA